MEAYFYQSFAGAGQSNRRRLDQNIHLVPLKNCRIIKIEPKIQSNWQEFIEVFQKYLCFEYQQILLLEWHKLTMCHLKVKTL